MVDSDKRRERIQVLRSLGFTHQQAFRLSNARGDKIQHAMSEAKKDLESIPRDQRTDSDRERLRAYRNIPLRNNSRILSRNEKREQWSEWSMKGGGGFPNRATERIRELNADAGKDRYDSYGYQAYYFEYVEEYDDVDDGDFYEER